MASLVTERIKDLQDLAVRWAQEPDGVPRQTFGFWLHSELASMFDKGLIKGDDLVDFNATVKILLDYILPLPLDADDE